MVADMKVDKVADVDININMEIHFGERVGHRGWLIWPKLFYPRLTRLACLLSFASSFFLLLGKFNTYATGGTGDKYQAWFCQSTRFGG